LPLTSAPQPVLYEWSFEKFYETSIWIQKTFLAIPGAQTGGNDPRTKVVFCVKNLDVLSGFAIGPRIFPAEDRVVNTQEKDVKNILVRIVWDRQSALHWCSHGCLNFSLAHYGQK